MDAMLCKDIDRPSECMLHFWGVAVLSTAVLCDIQVEVGGTQVLIPRILFGVSEKGAIFPKVPDDSDRTKFESARARLTVNADGSYTGHWFDSTGEGGEIQLAPDTTPCITGHPCTTWQQFLEWLAEIRREHGTLLFRGHGSSEFPLTTTLQRAGRHRLERYCSETLQRFHRHTEAALNMRIDLNNGDDYSMLLGLAQHFGLPTPLLDWTASPYVAAYFAFSDALDNRKDRPTVNHVRIFALPEGFLNKYSTEKVMLNYYRPYMSPLNVSFRNNPRLYAQQGSFTVTNHCNVVSLIQREESATGRQFLFAADLPVSLAVEVLQDLAFMGLTGATLFPGLEGVSRMLKHEMAFGLPTPELTGQVIDNSSTNAG
nr:FRG domain-containing protein [uncultured Duganella sp.]